MAKRSLAFVLSGGGSRGAMQVGALRALLEDGIRPDLLVGTSIGAINAAYLGLNGVTLESIDRLQEVWRAAAHADLMPSNYLMLTMRTLFNLTRRERDNPMYHFFINQGLKADVRFEAIKGVRVILVAADLNNGRTVLYGDDPQDSVLQSVLASAALPPWVPPIEVDDQILIDGGAVSNLPIEPALTHGATEIIALDLHDPTGLPIEVSGPGGLFLKLLITTQRRQAELELALAKAYRVPVRYISLKADKPLLIWDFSEAEALMAKGYAVTRAQMAHWPPPRESWWQALSRKLGAGPRA